MKRVKYTIDSIQNGNIVQFPFTIKTVLSCPDLNFEVKTSAFGDVSKNERLLRKILQSYVDELELIQSEIQ